MNISFNPQFSVLTIACLLSYNCIVDIHCRGKKLEEKELLFLSKTFSRLPNGGIDLTLDEIDEHYFCDFGDSMDSSEDEGQ